MQLSRKLKKPSTDFTLAHTLLDQQKSCWFSLFVCFLLYKVLDANPAWRKHESYYRRCPQGSREAQSCCIICARDGSREMVVTKFRTAEDCLEYSSHRVPCINHPRAGDRRGFRCRSLFPSSRDYEQYAFSDQPVCCLDCILFCPARALACYAHTLAPVAKVPAC